MNLVSLNKRAMYDLVLRHRQGIETAVRTMTSCWDIRVVFSGNRAYTDGHTIYLPNVDVFAAKQTITDAEIDTARAYFLALRGYAWAQAAKIVESDWLKLRAFKATSGSFAVGLAIGLDDIRAEHRFASRGQGIAETMEYARESWVWPRFARKKAKNGITNIMQEVFVGLQVMLKHYENREEHPAWKALAPEAKTFVERNVDDLDCAFDTLKMEKERGTERLTEVAASMLTRWGDEYKLVAPIAVRKVVLERKRAKERSTFDEDVQDDNWDEEREKKRKLEALDVDQSLDELLNVELPPLLLVTYSAKLSSLVSAKFAGQYVQRVEHVPMDAEGWAKLETLQPGETRTLVIHPPDPEHERALDELMGNLAKLFTQFSQEMAEEAERQVEEAKVEIQHLPADQQPYLVYTNEDDRFVTVSKADPKRLHNLREPLMHNHGIIKRRLEVLLRTRTQERWRDRQEEGEVLDPGAMADIALARHKPQERLMPYRQRQEKDDLLGTNVGLLCDVSGSMVSWKLELARQATLSFADCLDLGRIKFALWAFSSFEQNTRLRYSQASETEQALYGRFGGLYIETIKEFGESWHSVSTRLPNMGRYNVANYDADSVKWAAQQLLAQRCKRRVLFVLSDGQPSTGEPPKQVARQQLQLKKVTEAMLSLGVEVVGIGICDTSVTRYYQRNVVIQSAEDLPKAVMQQMNFLLLKHNR